jgi:leucyl aminopeptidase
VARSRGARKVGIALSSGDRAEQIAVLEGFGAGNYRFDQYKPESDRKAAIEQLTVLGPTDSSVIATAQALIDGTSMARDLVNETPAELYPETMADAARSLASEQLTVDVWDVDRLREAGMGGILAVGQGSSRPPRMIHLIYQPRGESRGSIALVGKGVTFDAGGLSLKSTTGMLTMRCDMAGGATVIGAMRAIRDLAPDVTVHGIVGAAENMPSADAYKLGDVLRIHNGKTVEVHNTDAEGRLVLADCLSFASGLGVDQVVDLATLTGACVVALGGYYSGLFTRDESLANHLLQAASGAGEGLWRMPLPEHYRDKLKADWAQVKNVGGKEAGAITAALFLSEFVDGPAWAHIDIAGPAFTDKKFRHLAPGGTGAMVPSLARWICGF